MKSGYPRWGPPGDSTERLAFLDNLRTVAIVMVVAVHTLGYCKRLPADQYAAVLFIVHSVSVPVFFLVDGFLFARHASRKTGFLYRDYIRKSAGRLLVPWAVFTVIYAFLRYFFEWSGVLTEKMVLGRSVRDVLLYAYGSVYAPQMYFLMSLFLIRLAAPVTMRVLRVESFQAFVLLFLTIHAAYRLTFQPAAVFLSIEGGQEPILHAWWGAQFYLMGIALYRFLRPAYDKKALSLSLAVFSCGLLLNSHFGFGALKDWVQYSYLIVFFLLARVFPRRSLLGDIIGRNTMGIYLVHAPVLLKGISLLLNKAVANPILSFLSILFATVAVSLLAALLFKTLPLGAFLFGETAERAG